MLYDILYVRDHILGKYFNPETNAMRWVLQANWSDRSDDKRLVAQLDQRNAYLILLTPTLPEPLQTESKQVLSVLARAFQEGEGAWASGVKNGGAGGLSRGALSDRLSA